MTERGGPPHVGPLRLPGDHVPHDVVLAQDPVRHTVGLQHVVANAPHGILACDVDHALQRPGGSVSPPGVFVIGEATARAPHKRYPRRRARVLTTEGCQYVQS